MRLAVLEYLGMVMKFGQNEWCRYASASTTSDAGAPAAAAAPSSSSGWREAAEMPSAREGNSPLRRSEGRSP